jgi:hypothetical protein
MDEAMATMKSHFNNLDAAIKNDIAVASQFGSSPVGAATTDMLTQGGVSVSCAASITSFQAAWSNSTCAALRDGVLSYSSASQSTVARWCTSGCIDLYLSVNAQVQLQCSVDRDTVWATYAAAQLTFRQGVW